MFARQLRVAWTPATPSTDYVFFMLLLVTVLELLAAVQCMCSLKLLLLLLRKPIPLLLHSMGAARCTKATVAAVPPLQNPTSVAYMPMNMETAACTAC